MPSDLRLVLQRARCKFFCKYLLTAALLFVSGCASAPRQPNVIRLTQEGDASSLDPAKAYDTTCIPYVRVLYRGLLDYDDKAVLRPKSRAPIRFRRRPAIHLRAARRRAFPLGAPRRGRGLPLRHRARARSQDRLRRRVVFLYSAGRRRVLDDRKKPPAQRKYLHVPGIEVEGQNTIRFA
jgi:hypothetical protein